MARVRDDTRSEARPRRGLIALIVVALLALTLAVGLTSHHDELAASTTPAAQGVNLADDVPMVPADGAVLACSFLLLCALALAAGALGMRRTAAPGPRALPRAEPSPRPPLMRIPDALSLATLSISRT